MCVCVCVCVCVCRCHFIGNNRGVRETHRLSPSQPSLPFRCPSLPPSPNQSPEKATAINIGFASRLLVHGMELRVANGRSADALKRTLSKHLDGARSGPASVDVKQQALVMDGESLAIVLEDAALAQQLYEIGQLCAVVLFCRVSPKQKADVVRLVISALSAVNAVMWGKEWGGVVSCGWRGSGMWVWSEG